MNRFNIPSRFDSWDEVLHELMNQLPHETPDPHLAHAGVSITARDRTFLRDMLKVRNPRRQFSLPQHACQHARRLPRQLPWLAVNFAWGASLGQYPHGRVGECREPADWIVAHRAAPTDWTRRGEDAWSNSDHGGRFLAGETGGERRESIS